MRNAIIRELSALLGIDKTCGEPYQPTYQAPTERSHVETQATLTCLLEDLAKGKPTQWESLLPVAEYVVFIRPMGSSGICPRDLDNGWSLAVDMDRDLVPFEVSPTEWESEFAASLLTNYLQLKQNWDEHGDFKVYPAKTQIQDVKSR